MSTRTTSAASATASPGSSQGSTRSWVKLGALAAAFALILIGPTLFSADRIVSAAGQDLDGQYVAWRSFAFSNGFPLWNPHVFGGAPFLAGGQTGMLYPIDVVLYRLFQLRTAINLDVTAHLALAWFLMALWCRHRGASFWASAAGATAFAASGPYLAHVYPGHLSNLGTMAWMPGIFLGIDAIIAAPSLSAIVATAGAVSMAILAGHLQYVYYSSIVASLYAAIESRRSPTPWRVWLYSWAVYPLAGAVCAAQLLPSIAAGAESARSSASYEFASSFYFPFERIVSLIIPGSVEDFRGIFNFWETTAYIGVPALLTAWWGMRRVGSTRGLVAVAVVSFVLALGAQTPIYDFLFTYMPWFSSLRGAGKFIFFAALMAGPIVAAGADSSHGPPPWVIFLGVAFGSVLFASRVVVSQPFSEIMRTADAIRLAPRPPDNRVFGTSNKAMLAGADDIWGNDPMVTKRWAEFMAFTQGSEVDEATQDLRIIKASPLLGLTRISAPGIRALPRFSIVHQAVVGTSRDQILEKVASAPADLGNRVVLESMPLPAPQWSEAHEEVRVEGTWPNSTDLMVDLDRAGVLFVTDAYANGWKAIPLPGSDQDRYDLVPADWAFRAIPLGRGHHHIRMAYRPRSFDVGMAVSLSTLFIILLVAGHRWAGKPS